MARRIVWSSRARRDKNAIYKYWNDRNGSNAYSRTLRSLFQSALNIIKDHLGIGRKANSENVHIKVVKDYLIIYEVTESVIFDISVWDGRRDPTNLKIV